MTKTMPIFFSINDAYAPYLSVAMTSIIAHANPKRHYALIILCDDLSADNQQKLGQQATSNVTIQFVPMQDSLKAQLGGEHMKLRGDTFTLTIYFRLFIAAMFPQYDRGIYLDADVVATTDLADLFDQPLESQLVGAVTDTFAADNSQSIAYVEQHLKLPIADYFNSGVMLMNLNQMRAEHFNEKFMHCLTDYQVDFIAPDQDYLNLLCRNRVLKIDRAWNVMPTTQTRVSAPKLVHYSLFGKPWYYADAQNGHYFWAIAPQSPYYDEIKAIQRAYTDADRAQDRVTEQGLLRQLGVFSSQDRTALDQMEGALK